jgi:hypothetical protein
MSAAAVTTFAGRRSSRYAAVVFPIQYASDVSGITARRGPVQGSYLQYTFSCKLLIGVFARDLADFRSAPVMPGSFLILHYRKEPAQKDDCITHNLTSVLKSSHEALSKMQPKTSTQSPMHRGCTQVHED